MYNFLLEHAIEIIEKVFEETDFSESDIFERLRKIGIIKFKFQKKYPQIFDFLKAIREEKSPVVIEDINQKTNASLESGLERIYENIDWSKFREDVDIQKAIDILNWTMIGFGEREVKKLNSFSEIHMDILNEWNSYSELLKSCFYKKEGE
ncbi:TetR/AcrR family transcriptional regulator [Anaerobacillus sp. MEB173]|uniref:TetR/AcrR family transcriptional regulator n=1 Tax=Anaerobacillus sp. MEB173 TaxID=3383345 RepID=UPI003F918A93